MHRMLTAGVLTFVLVSVPLGFALAAGPVTNTPPSSVSIPPVPVVPPATPATGLGAVNPFATLANPGNTSFQPGVPNPFDNPHPMLPWGDGQIGGERYGQVIRYWQNQPQTVNNVIFVVPLPEEATPPPTEPQPQGQPSPPQGALDARAAKQPEGRSVTVPAYWIVETTRGYVHMPRWALQEVGGGRYQWVLVGSWFQPR